MSCAKSTFIHHTFISVLVKRECGERCHTICIWVPIPIFYIFFLKKNIMHMIMRLIVDLDVFFKRHVVKKIISESTQRTLLPNCHYSTYLYNILYMYKYVSYII